MSGPSGRMRSAVGIVAAFAIALGVLPTAMMAQDGPLGVGIVVAPENGIWSCAGSTPEAAFGCARRECRSAGEADCYRTAWCYPGGWGALYSQRTAEFHGPNGFCGAPSREEALATVERWCRSQDYLVSCFVSTIITPDGTEEDVSVEFNFDR
jgi:hypothetical protein